MVAVRTAHTRSHLPTAGLALLLAPNKRAEAEKAWRDEVAQYDRLIELKPDSRFLLGPMIT